MQKIIFWGVLFGVLPAYSAGENRLHLLDMKCETEAHDELETSPQSPPLAVDDPATPGCNKWEINVLLDGDITMNEKNWELPLLDMNYGVGDNLQLKYEVPNVNAQSADSSVSGIGSSKAGIKYMFFENEESELQMAIYPQVEFITPNSGAEEKGLSTPGTVTTLPLLLSKKIGETSKGKIMFTTNVGYNISSKTDSTDSVSVLAGVGLPLLSKVSIMGEVATEQAVSENSDGVREQLVKANIGMMGTLYKRILLYGSLGESLYSTDQKKHTYMLVGVRL